MSRSIFGSRRSVSNAAVFLAAFSMYVGTGVALAAPETSWYPSRYGADDTIGAANNLSPDLVRSAANLVKTGKVYSLAVAVDPATPARSYRKASVSIVQPGAAGGKAIGPNKFTTLDDVVFMAQGLGTHIDGLGHAGIDFRYYNGKKAEEFVWPGGVTAYSVHSIPPIVTRGVLLDMARLRGVAAMGVGDAITVEDILTACERQGVTIKRGDVVLFHTGWDKAAKQGPPRTNIDEPGLGLEASRFLANLGVVAVGVDNDAIEVIPSEDSSLVLPVHQEMLAKYGVYLLEHVVTEELANDEAWEFMFVAAAPRIVGTVQGPLHPVAIR